MVAPRRWPGAAQPERASRRRGPHPGVSSPLRVYHLPAYLALSRLVLARRVVVVQPRTLAGPRALLRAGAREVLVVGADLPPEDGIQVRAEIGTNLPLRDGTVDVVCAIESFGAMPNRRRRELLREAFRVARPDGVFAAWIEQPDGDVFGQRLRGATTVDFWSLEDELSVIFKHVYMLAQMPWRGFSLAPVLDDDDPAAGEEPAVRLDEGLLAEPPAASHYLAVAGKSALPTSVARECLLVPVELESVSQRSAEVDDLADELDRLREELSVRAAKAAAAQRRVQELEGQLQSAQVDADRVGREALEEMTAELESARAQHERARRRNEEQSTSLAQAQARVSELEEQLASVRVAEGEASGQSEALGSELASLRARLEQAQTAAAEAQTEREAAHRRVEELESTVAEMKTQRDAEGSELERARAALERIEAAELESRETLEAARAREDELARELEDARGRERSLQEELESVRAASGELERAGAETADSAQRAAAELAQLRADLEAQRDKVRAQETDLSILTRTLKDSQAAFSRLEDQDTERRQQLETVRDELSELRGRAQATESERDELRRQLDVVLAEREGARSLASRVEAELEVARRRMREQEEQLAAKIEEASRVSGEAEVIRRRLVDQDAQLAETRSKAEQLTAQAEQGRMLADVAFDRDRLREELGQRRQEIEKLEERLWQARDALQKEKIEAVRIGGELERYKEQAERSRAAERERAQELETLGRTLREAEVARAELEVSLRMRDERIAQLTAEASALEGQSEDVDALRTKLEERGNQVAELSGALEQARLREKQALDLTRRRERELDDGGRRILELQRIGDEQAKLAAELSAELEVKEVQIEELAAQVSNLQRQQQDQRNQLAMRDRDRNEFARKLEDAAAETRSLRKQLRQREQELDDLASSQENNAAEVLNLRRELEAAARATESDEDADRDPAAWPTEARAEIRKLRLQVESLEAQTGPSEKAANTESTRLQRFRLEAEVRATEQEFILSRLDAAEQQIWEMTDASDRNAARFAASLAQLEKQKEKVDQLVDELEVTRSLLSSEQARALEQERLLASERAKLARAGIDVSGFPSRVPDDEVDRLFSEMESPAGGANLVDLTQRQRGDATPASTEAGAPSAVHDRSASGGIESGSIRRTPESPAQRARMVIEMEEGDEEEWPEEGAMPADDDSTPD